MTMELVRPYFRTILKNLGYSEWKDPFNFENVPNSVADLSFHITSGPMRGAPQNQADLELSCEVTLRLIFKPRDQDVSAGIDRALSKTDAVVLELLKASNRLTGNLKNLTLSSAIPEPFADSNDNMIVVRLEMVALVILPTT